MGWTAPRTWTTGEVVTKTIMDAHVKDNLRYLKGLDGTITLSDGLDLGTNELTINSTEIVGVDGEVNKAAVEDHTHADAANCGTIDHGILTGKDDDDHTQYTKKATLTTRGDIYYASATDTPARLAKGTEGQVLRQGANDPAWASAAATQEFFVHFMAGSGALDNSIDYLVYMLDATQIGYASLKVPHDFTALTHCKVICFHSNSENIDWTVGTDFAADGEANNNGSDTATANNLAMTAAQITSIDISAAFTGIAADDYIGIKFTLDTAAAGLLRLLGIVFKYS